MSVPFQTIDKGHNSAIEDALTKVYRTRQDFEVFWGRHGSNCCPPPNVPDVDFTTRMVAVVYMGTQNSGGYSVEVTSVDQKEDGDLEVHFMTSVPGPRGFVTCSLTQPYHIISVDATDKNVSFVGSAEVPPPDFPIPRFIVSFVKGAEVDAIVTQIEALPTIKNVNVLGSMRIVFVDFDSKKTNKDEALNFLKDLKGVKYVEEE